MSSALPPFVDVVANPGRRVRIPGGDGALLPEGHVLRGQVRSAALVRLELDGDVTLTPSALPDDPAQAPEAAALHQTVTADAPASAEAASQVEPASRRSKA